MAAISIPGGVYQVPVDIANAACDHMGLPYIATFQDNTKVAKRLSFRYDKVRRYELERNLWVFSIRKAILRPLDTTSMHVTFAAWSATATYVLGSVVADPTTGTLYQALGAVPVDSQPALNPTLWSEYFGPQTADVWTMGVAGGPQPWVSATNYAANMDVVGSDGNVYLSLANGNQGNNPVTDGGVHWMLLGIAPTGLGYWPGELVYLAGQGTTGVYLSVAGNNISTPNTIPAWVNTQIYNAGQTVTYSATTYQSTSDLNVDNTPGASGAWETVPVTQTDTPQGTQWLYLGSATLSSIALIYPLGYGPSSDTSTRNIFALPYGWLREAPQDPKAGQLTWLGGPGNNIMNDWVFENGYLLSSTYTPINMRFGADVQNVALMDPMFCELFAARLALEECEVLTQAADKKQAISAEYARWGSEARTRNGIEIGPVQNDEDEYITVRR